MAREKEGYRDALGRTDVAVANKKHKLASRGKL